MYDTKMSPLTRVDVQEIKSDQSLGDDQTIADKETVDLLWKAFEEIKWQQNVKAEMSRIEDVEATLFFDFDKNMPERLVVYSIWFNQSNETSTIIIRDEKLYRTLDKENKKTLKEDLLVTKKAE